MVKFHIPAVENAKVGDTVTVVLYNDNNLTPPTGDLSIYLDWNMEVLKYESSTFKQGRTTAADIVGLHNLNIMAADTTNGFPQGDNPLIEMKFKVIGPGYTPIVIKVASITDTTGANIASKAVVSNGAVTATGTALKTTGTTGVTTGATTVATTGAVQTFTPLPTTVPVSGVTTSAVANPVTAVPVVSGPGDGAVQHGRLLGHVDRERPRRRHRHGPGRRRQRLGAELRRHVHRHQIRPVDDPVLDLVDPRRQHDGRRQERTAWSGSCSATSGTATRRGSTPWPTSPSRPSARGPRP